MKNDICVVMQSYNTEEYKLLSAINSVIEQTFNNFSFVFIDDWSTIYDVDALFEKIKQKWTNARRNIKDLHLVKRPQSSESDAMTHNHGHSFCRNWALGYIRMAELSDYVFFADSDDELSIYCLEFLWNNMKKDPNIDISIGNFTRNEVEWVKNIDFHRAVYNGDAEISDFPFKIYNNYESLDILCDPYMLPGHKLTKPSVAFCATWNKIFRLSLFDDVRFPDYKTKDDNFTAHRLLYKARKVIFTPTITYFYRPGGKLADANLYKTKDIIDAHLDRVGFFDYAFRMPYKDDFRILNISKYNEFYDEQYEIKIYYNEYMIMLYTYMMYISQAEDLSINERKRMAEILRDKLMSEFKELMLYEPKFVKMVMEFIEKVEK